MTRSRFAFALVTVGTVSGWLVAVGCGGANTDTSSLNLALTAAPTANPASTLREWDQPPVEPASGTFSISWRLTNDVGVAVEGLGTDAGTTGAMSLPQNLNVRLRARAPEPGGEPARVTCEVQDVHNLEPSEGALAAHPALAEALISQVPAGLPRTHCSFGRGPRARIEHVEILTPDQTTGDSDDEGDGLVRVGGPYVVTLRMALRLASVPFPPGPLSEGKTWVITERGRLDHATVQRTARYTLIQWTAGGARVKVDVDETAAPQTIDPLAELRDAVRGTSLPPGVTTALVTPLLNSSAGATGAPSTLAGAQLHAEGELDVDSAAMLPTGTLRVRGQHSVSAGPVHENGSMRAEIAYATVDP